MATVVGLFENTSQAQAAVQDLRNSGIAADDISVAMRTDEAEATQVNVDTGGAGGAVTGAVGGGILGGLAGLLVCVGAIAIPGIGPVAVAGPLGTALTTTLVGAGIGAAAGGLVGALVDAGVPEEEARVYETGVARGGVLVSARVADGQEGMARDILNRNGARDIQRDAALYSDPNYRYGSTTGVDDDRGVVGEAVGGAGGAVAGGV